MKLLLKDLWHRFLNWKHRRAHDFKMHRGYAVYWYAAVPGFRPRTMTGFKCATCGKVDSAREYKGAIPKPLATKMRKGGVLR